MSEVIRPPMDHVGRLVALRREIAELDLDAMWVTRPVNVRWLTGFTGSNGQVLVTAADVETDTDAPVVLVTDNRYRDQAAETLAEAGLDDQVAVELAVSPEQLLVRRSPSRLGIEGSHLTIDGFRQIEQWLPNTDVVAGSDRIGELRRIKDPGERARLEQAAAIADAAWAAVLPSLVPGVSERVFARQLDQAMLDGGADELSFETIVASGPNSARPHARPGDRLLESGDLVVMDFGARVDGYGSDMTRTVVAGGEPSARQIEMYEAVRAAQAAGVAAVRAGVEERHIDATCRATLEEHGMADAFIHGTGHGIGLEIHEGPILSTRSVGILPAGLVVTVEPGVYFPGEGGVRIEDSVVVTDSGCSPITHSPKGLAPQGLTPLDRTGSR